MVRRSTRSRAFAFVLALAAGGGCGGDSLPEDVVATDDGEVQGLLDTDTRRFLGIPYAAPPVGDLRFAAPAPPEPWDRKQTMAFGPACPQPPRFVTDGLTDLSEDCLYLNVYTPRPAFSRAPVMVWVHGGSFLRGAASEPIFDARGLARRGVVVVTFNYRLGALGFLAYSGTSGTQGIEDQRAALRWVQHNIAGFGGDPSRVTLFGQSAGAISVYIHLADPASGGLFHRAIVESGFISSSGIINAPTTQQASDQAMQLAVAVGCADLACLRQVDAMTLVQGLKLGDFDFGKASGVLWLPPIAAPIVAFKSGHMNKVPVILGTNRDEATALEAVDGPTTEDAYRARVTAQFGADAEAVLAQYPVSKFGSPKAAASALFGDAAWVSDARRAARALVAAGVPVWRYSFERVPELQPFPNLGAYHGAELRFVFGSTWLHEALTPAEEMLGSIIRDDWVAFARDGKPATSWPAYDAATDPYLRFADGATAKTGLKTAECDFWDGIYTP